MPTTCYNFQADFCFYCLNFDELCLIKCIYKAMCKIIIFRNKKCEVEEAATNLSSTPDQKEYSSTPENLSRSSTPISKASESDWQPPTHGSFSICCFVCQAFN